METDPAPQNGLPSHSIKFSRKWVIAGSVLLGLLVVGALVIQSPWAIPATVRRAIPYSHAGCPNAGRSRAWPTERPRHHY